MIIWWNVQLYNCMASVYSKQPTTINLLSSSPRFTVEQSQKAQKTTAFQEVPLRLQFINELIFIFKGRVQKWQLLPSFPKGREWWKNGCNTFVISKLSEEVSIFEQRLKQEQNRG